jgi:hypothetical protein
MLNAFLSARDANRALRTFRTLAKHRIDWALTGGLAVEMHCLSMGNQVSPRPLNDIDFIVESFDHLPSSLADDFLFRHIHPFDPPGKTLLQCIDADTRIRIDVFRAYGAIMNRSHPMQLGETETIRVLSLEDLVARLARLSLDLADGIPTPSKYVTDFLRMEALVEPGKVESVWAEHRKLEHPKSFTDAANLLKNLAVSRPELLVSPSYSQNVEDSCSRCVSTSSFQLAPPRLVVSLLGYC